MRRSFVRQALQIGLVGMMAAGCSPNEAPQAESAAPQAAAAPSSSSAARGDAAAARDACTLITLEEAAKILGSPAKATPGASSNHRSTCDYVTQSYQSFTLEAIWSGAEQEISTARSAATAASGAAGGTQDTVVSDVMGLQRVDGLGDEAYFARRGMSYVRKGDVLLVFQTAGLEEPAREHWEALARAALARL